MATEFPIEQDYGRFIPGVEQEAPEDEMEAVDLSESEIEELPDGSAVVTISEGPIENPDFYENLADVDRYDDYEISSLALRYIELIEKDKESRKQRDKQY